MKTPKELMALYKAGENISSLLRKEKGSQYNDEEAIEISYDLQTGTYVSSMKDESMARHKAAYTAEIARVILSLCKPISILEAGIGEATTLAGVIKSLGQDQVRSYGFDLSWSRVAYARGWLRKQNINDVTLCTGSLLNIPFASNSIDIVYTSHSLEPNHGREEPILQELYRITKRFLILLEPGYELASDEARQRMDFHCYCKNLKGTSEALGHKVIRHDLFPFTSNPLNPTAITIVEKEIGPDKPSHVLACPRFKTALRELGGMLFSPEALVVYPVLAGIPCLRIENGILASKYPEIQQALLDGTRL